ncbi:holin [Crassaminicella thermophila]|uniref:Holin n=1 Tax=Crassaminicella thermophila TaxID=2599308 RepID=A0A5C0SEN2_CRATE|nr:phage holin family protein [Crassaminicella thermophila]QEK11708.1 holin [Crassaminicella thermophila]
MDIMNFVLEQNLIIIGVVYVLGVFLKNLKMIEDKFIPFILLVFAIVFSLLTADISTTEKVAKGVMQGILITGAAVLGNQMWKQSTKKRIPDDRKEDAGA